MPYPANVETALAVEDTVRRGGAFRDYRRDRRLHKVGIDRDQIEYLATAKGVRKVSRRDLPAVIAVGADGRPPWPVP